jgi:tRNA(fMet)-specific endonuclease VapC
MYVLDTNTVAYFFRGEGRIATRLLRASPGEVAIPAIAAYELRLGLARLGNAARRIEQLEQFLATIRVLPFDDATARVAAAIRVDLERAGQPIGPLDVLIAATALHSAGTLVTRNVSEFGRVPGLRVENWYQ